MSASSKRLLIPILFILSCYPAAGQVKSGTHTDSIMVRAELLMSREEYSQAAECYRAVLETEPDHIPALLGMGWTLLSRKDWSRAEDQFDKVLKQDQDNLDVNYGKGICQREIGVSRAFLQRRMLWKNAEKHLEFVIDRDSAFKEVLYQRAVLEE